MTATDRRPRPTDGTTRWRHGVAVRASGLAGCLMAYLAIAAVARVDAPAARLALAAIGFLFGSIGGALLWLGDHVFDRVIVSDQWRRLSTPPPDHRVGAQ